MKNIVDAEYATGSYMLCDIYGRMILKSGEKQIDLSSFRDGMYFLKIFNDNDFVTVWKILKIY